jgi:hypothetical protein
MTHVPSLLEALTYGESQVKLLRAASDILGGDKALAQHLDIRESLLASLMSGRHRLPTQLLVLALDIILQEREGKCPPASGLRPEISSRDANG